MSLTQQQQNLHVNLKNVNNFFYKIFIFKKKFDLIKALLNDWCDLLIFSSNHLRQCPFVQI